MRRLTPFVLLFLLSLAQFALPKNSEASADRTGPQHSAADELIAAVNALRASRGLPAYTPHPILMQIAQSHAEYLMSIGVSNTHISADGLRPFQRALQAGYAVAGDLSLGGFISENVVGGQITPSQAVEIWIGSEPHLNTMISTDLRDIGAGVAVSGNTYYYVIVCGLSTGGTPVPFTPPPSYKTPLATMIPNTPNADGSVTYIVQPNDTLLEIAISYDVSLDYLRTLNGLSDDMTIYPDQVLIIFQSFTPTPTLPTSTPTTRPSITPWPSSTATIIMASPTALPTEKTSLPASTAGGAVGIIIIAALVVAAILSLTGKKQTPPK